VTKAEADNVLYLVDQLRDRGALVVEVAGIKAVFGAQPGAQPKGEKRTERSYHDRLFGPLGIVKAKR